MGANDRRPTVEHSKTGLLCCEEPSAPPPNDADDISKMGSYIPPINWFVVGANATGDVGDVEIDPLSPGTL